MIEFKADKSSKKEFFIPPTSFEATFTCTLPEDSPLLEWIRSRPDPQKVLKQVEEFMKKYDISPDRIMADRSMLKWLFLDDKDAQEVIEK